MREFNMPNFALINNQNIVENVISWDGLSEWNPPENMICVNIENLECGIGCIYDGSIFIKPKPVELEPTPQPTKEELLAQLNALSAQIQALT